MDKIITYSLILFTIFLISCTQQYTKTDGKMTGPLPREQASQEIQPVKEENVINVDLKAEDNVDIKATFYKGKNDMPSIILVHMLGRTRNDWNDFAISLQSLGYNVISIDLRGHGESSSNWRLFSAADFNNMVLDVKSSKEFLIKNSVGNKIAIIGASIGANIALNYAAQDVSIKTIILLSPGLDYRGVKTDAAIIQFKNPILIAASDDDSYAAESSKTLNSLSKNSSLKIYNGSLHGTNLFGKTDADKIVVDWLKSNLK